MCNINADDADVMLSCIVEWRFNQESDATKNGCRQR